MLKTFLRTIAGITFLLAVAWIYSDPVKFDGWIAGGVSLLAFAGLFEVGRREHRERENISQQQSVGPGGFGVQAGRDAHISAKENHRRG